MFSISYYYIIIIKLHTVRFVDCRYTRCTNFALHCIQGQYYILLCLPNTITAYYCCSLSFFSSPSRLVWSTDYYFFFFIYQLTRILSHKVVEYVVHYYTCIRIADNIICVQRVRRVKTQTNLKIQYMLIIYSTYIKACVEPARPGEIFKK